MCSYTPAPRAKRSSCASVPSVQCSGWTDRQMDRSSIPKPPCPAGSKGSRRACALQRAEWKVVINSPFRPSCGKVGKRGGGETLTHLLPPPPSQQVPLSSPLPGPVLPTGVCTTGVCITGVCITGVCITGSHPAPSGRWATSLPCSPPPANREVRTSL